MRLAWLAALVVLSACSNRAPAERPNIVLLLVDDLGWNDVSYHSKALGGSEIATPSIDRLAEQGLRLERFYMMPQCTTSRASLLTGKLPMRLGAMDNLHPHDQWGLPTDERTLADVLRAAGYHTALVGKWHLGHASREQRPLARGFDTFYGCLQGYVDYYLHTRNDALDWWRGEEPLEEEGYATRLIADESARILGEQAGAEKPLFLFVSFTAPHTPLQPAPERSVDELPQSEQIRACYVGMVEELDDAIGEILDAIDANGLTENTLVLFASDNGGSPRHGADNAPLRDGKFGAFEGGVRVPAVVRWPGKLPANAASDQIASVQDLLPTLAEAAGADVPRGLDGESVLDAWRTGETHPRGDLAFGVHRPNSHRYAVRRGRWKLVEVRNLPLKRVETMLFDVEADPEETRDLADEHPEIVRELKEALAGFEALEDR